MKKPFKEFQNQSSELRSIIIYSIVLGISINILSGILNDLLSFPRSLNLIIWAVIIVVTLIVSQILKQQKLNCNIKLSGFFITDKEQKNKLHKIPEYSISSDMVRFFEAACIENPALQIIWERAELDKLLSPNKNREEAEAAKECKKLLEELLEYCILDQFSTFIGDYFNSRDITSKIVTYSGNDIPSVLLQNRFLKLLSEDPKNRAAFYSDIGKKIYAIDDSDKDNEKGTLVYMIGANGVMFNRFELTIPNGSNLYREKDNTIVVDTKLFTLKYKIDFSGFSSFIEPEFYLYYLHEPECRGKFHKWKYDVEISVKYKFLSLFKFWNWKYYNWLDDYINHLAKYCDEDTFYNEIGWKGAKTMLRILRTAKKPSKSAENE